MVIVAAKDLHCFLRIVTAASYPLSLITLVNGQMNDVGLYCWIKWIGIYS
jgi:hypothetical protein